MCNCSNENTTRIFRICDEVLYKSTGALLLSWTVNEREENGRNAKNIGLLFSSCATVSRKIIELMAFFPRIQNLHCLFMLREGKKTVLVYNFNLLFEDGNSHEIAPSKYSKREKRRCS